MAATLVLALELSRHIAERVRLSRIYLHTWHNLWKTCLWHQPVLSLPQSPQEVPNLQQPPREPDQGVGLGAGCLGGLGVGQENGGRGVGFAPRAFFCSTRTQSTSII
eukprot:TRINITY_DN4168_c0_g1_i2.p7 TRINITY_DN4168_c0_g1~~TRINITY_DN4168_c0_g1_i2.p7  ORF type:complete len:107 (+),score=7.14 TRINITY_DN4168_c0_g1_i2:529-849(+)